MNAQPTINYSIFPPPPPSNPIRRRRNRNQTKMVNKKTKKALFSPRETFIILTLFSPIVGPLMSIAYSYLTIAGVEAAHRSLEMIRELVK